MDPLDPGSGTDPVVEAYKAGVDRSLIRANLRRSIEERLEALAKLQEFAEEQPRVSDLLRGRIDAFSTDALIDMLARLGTRVRFTVKPTPRRLRVA
jgi:predicted XRE-type DNA-binding protein